MRFIQNLFDQSHKSSPLKQMVWKIIIIQCAKILPKKTQVYGHHLALLASYLGKAIIVCHIPR